MARAFSGKVKIGLSMDTNALRNATTRMGRAIRQASNEACQATARELSQIAVTELVDIMETQRYKFRWPPLKPRYLRWKIRHGLDPRILIATGFYKEHITSWKDNRAKGTAARYVYGLRPTHQHPNAKMPLHRLALIHEYGAPTVNIPPRPLWRPFARNLIRRRALHRDLFQKHFAVSWKRVASKYLAGARR